MISNGNQNDFCKILFNAECVLSESFQSIYTPVNTEGLQIIFLKKIRSFYLNFK